MRRVLAPVLLLLLAAVVALAENAADPARRFLGEWRGPANVYDDTQVLKPTNAHVRVLAAPGDTKKYVVELTIFGDQLTRLTQCELTHVGEMAVRETLLVDLRRVRVEGVLHSLNGRRIEEGYIRFFIETAQGDFRPYYAVKFAAQRVTAPAATPAPVAPTPAAAPPPPEPTTP